MLFPERTVGIFEKVFFVDGFLGEQFALPEALDSLRMVRRDAERDGAPPVSVAAADPLNLTGIIIPGERVSALSKGVVEVVGTRGAPGQPLEYSGSLRPGQIP